MKPTIKDIKPGSRWCGKLTPCALEVRHILPDCREPVVFEYSDGVSTCTSTAESFLERYTPLTEEPKTVDCSEWWEVWVSSNKGTAWTMNRLHSTKDGAVEEAKILEKSASCRQVMICKRGSSVMGAVK